MEKPPVRCLRRLRILWLYIALSFLSGCQGVHPVTDTLTMTWPWRSQYAQLLPGVEYMVVTLDGRATVMALGERHDRSGSAGSERHEYWYSSQHEMLHLVNGRIQRALGFTVEWRSQVSLPPRWTDVGRSRYEAYWSRVLDIMPGYRMGHVDHLWVKPSAAPTKLPEGVTTNAVWFEEAVLSKTPEGQAWEFQQRFAVLGDKVIYSEQCLAPSICLSLRLITVEHGP